MGLSAYILNINHVSECFVVVLIAVAIHNKVHKTKTFINKTPGN